jgi:manganese-dependent ADP-ribose/CDP-alcohol diphosphatase
MNSTNPLFSFGVIADPQYADTEDGTNFDKTITRRYRQSFETLKAACAEFEKYDTLCNIVLGDTLDGKAGKLDIHDQCLQEIADATFGKTPKKWHFATGNHDLYCFPRDQLKDKLYGHVDFSPRAESGALYYDFVPYAGFRFIVLDSFDVSEMSASTPANYDLAVALLCAKNHNYAAGRHLWLEGISDEDARYTPANGALSAEQLAWLKDTLQEALEKGQKCFVFNHVPTYVRCTQPSTLLWNCEDVQALLQSFPNVVAFLAGHDHDGGYAQDEVGIHHLVPPAPLECDVDELAYGRVLVYPDGMELVWTGRMPVNTHWPQTMKFRV